MNSRLAERTRVFHDTTNGLRRSVLTRTPKYEPALLRDRPALAALESPTKEFDQFVNGAMEDYAMGRFLGKGAYATVRLATHAPTQALVAFK